MAKDKKSFILYADLIHTVKKLPKEKAGELFNHILEYVNDLNPTSNDLMIELVFEPIKHQLKRDLKRYESKKKQWSNAGKASAKARVNKREQPLTDVKQRSTVSTVNDTVTVNGTVNGTVNDIEEIYKSYPSKCFSNRSTSKSVKDKSKIKSLLKKNTKDELLTIIDYYIKDCNSTQTYIKNFGTFLNNLPDLEEAKQNNLTQAERLKIKMGLV